MMLNLYNKISQEPESRDLLDLNLDMRIEQEGDVFYVDLNGTYRLYDSFESKEAAKEQMFWIADLRNKVETELREYM